MAAVGAVIGLLLITKVSALPVAIPLIPLAFMVTGWKRRTEILGIGVLSALVVTSWYLVQIQSDMATPWPGRHLLVTWLRSGG
jgi:predicted branched-subunit amino acid permease